MKTSRRRFFGLLASAPLAAGAVAAQAKGSKERILPSAEDTMEAMQRISVMVVETPDGRLWRSQRTSVEQIERDPDGAKRSRTIHGVNWIEIGSA